MFNIESYVTPILLSYVDKYVRDFKPADAQVSLWGGGVALHNLVLKADVLQREVALPFTLVSGRIHELLIQVPWTKIISEPIVVTIDTIECVLSLRRSVPNDEGPSPEPSRKQPVVEAPPGYMQALVRRVVSNISLRVHHLIVKYAQDDIVLSLNVKHLNVVSAGVNWEPSFADIEQNNPVIRRLVDLDDLTLCLDRSDSDGKIRFFQEPILYRCQLQLRVLTRLQSANTRRATNLNVQMRSSTLAWGVTSEQLSLLLRLLKERPAEKPPPPPARTHTAPPHASTLPPQSASGTEPARENSWSEWAWSWLPTWMDKEADVEEPAHAHAPIPIQISTRFDKVQLVLKVMETDSSSKRRARSVLEFSALHAAVKSLVCSPTTMRLQIGLRSVKLTSQGKCVCGLPDYEREAPSVHLSVVEERGEWAWPADDLDCRMEGAEVAEEAIELDPEVSPVPNTTMTQPVEETARPVNPGKEVDAFWASLAPAVFLDYTHDRSPPNVLDNPYDNPPTDFEYSDWVETCSMKVRVEPLELVVTAGLIHRCATILEVMRELPVTPEHELTLRTLTVEEAEALSENLPCQRVCVDVRSFSVRVVPWEHLDRDRSPTLNLRLTLDHVLFVVTKPLYPDRVCSAAAQLHNTSNSAVCRAARRSTTVSVGTATAWVCGPADLNKPCGHAAAAKCVLSSILRPELFPSHRPRNTYHTLIHEIKMCGSAARLMAAREILTSVVSGKHSQSLRYSSLINDVIKDEDDVAIDASIEEISARGYFTAHVQTHMMVIQTVKATMLHKPYDTDVRQAWLCAIPDIPSTTPAARLALQYCMEPIADSFDYLGLWVEPVAAVLDPLFVAYVNYQPTLLAQDNYFPTVSSQQSKCISASQYFRRKVTPPSSSGRGNSRAGSAGELVHAVRPRSLPSSEPSEKKTTTVEQPKEPWYVGANLVALHERLRHLLLTVETGVVLLYVTTDPASALDTVTVREAVERHGQIDKVLAVSWGKLCIYSCYKYKNLWHDIRHDGPTYITPKIKLQITQQKTDDSFPWKIHLADMSCYTMVCLVSPTDREKSADGLRSQLKVAKITQKTVVELVTTTVTVTVVTKTRPRNQSPKPEVKRTSDAGEDKAQTKYFKMGLDFKPSTLKEFLRGPSSRKDEKVKDSSQTKDKAKSGPVVSLGVHLHADTPPVIVKLGYDEVALASAAIHMLNHVVSAVKREPFRVPPGFQPTNSHKNLPANFRSSSELEIEKSEETMSNQIVSIFETAESPALRASFWFQWVVSRATLVLVSAQVKLAFDIDDIISTVDIQAYYNQLKIKVASASLRHYKKNIAGDWHPGVLGGRVIEAKEPADAKQDNHFLAITITQAQISSLPQSWREELHPKLLEQTSESDTMWEIFAMLAQLEVLLQPALVSELLEIMQLAEMKSECLLTHAAPVPRTSPLQWPFLYLDAGGLRLIITRDEDDKSNVEDSILFVVGKIMINPHPENPICRQQVRTEVETSWIGSSPCLEGRQFELLIQRIGVKSTLFRQLVNEEEAEMNEVAGNENPAVKWTRHHHRTAITPILHKMDIGLVLAPPLYVGGVFTSGAGFEINFLSDCRVELSLQQIELMYQLFREFTWDLYSDSEQSVSHPGLHQCPLAKFLASQYVVPPLSSSTDEDIKTPVTSSGLLGTDSGLDSVSQSTLSASLLKRNLFSILPARPSHKPSEYWELFVTMGTVELSLYVKEDARRKSADLSEIKIKGTKLSHPSKFFDPDLIPVTPVRNKTTQEHVVQMVLQDDKVDQLRKPLSGTKSVQSLPEDIRDAGQGKTMLEKILPYVRTYEGNVPMFHITLQQPNLYYWKKKNSKNIQLSLFNLWLGLGAGEVFADWHLTLLSAAHGSADPLTDIPPALLTCNIILPDQGMSTARGSIKIDVDRPVLAQVCVKRLRIIKVITKLIKEELNKIEGMFEPEHTAAKNPAPFLFKLKNIMLQKPIECVTITTNQIGVSGRRGSVSLEGLKLQLAAGILPERLNVRGLITALFVTAGAPMDDKHIILDPMMVGIQMEATWEAWVRVEGGSFALQPTINMCLEVDSVNLDVRPRDVRHLKEIVHCSHDLLEPIELQPMEQEASLSSAHSWMPGSTSSCSEDSKATSEQHYKDDLRSGAFKVVNGGQLPMAYQVILGERTVTWRYPHPRAITRIVAFPVPEVDEEVECVLEVYTTLLNRWETHTYFKLPVNEPRDLQLYVSPPDSIFSVMWRFRACPNPNIKPKVFKFNLNKFLPKQDPLITEIPGSNEGGGVQGSRLSGPQLWGVLRVDSYTSPHMIPRTSLALSIATLNLYISNELPQLTLTSPLLEGYYVSKLLQRNHRVVCLSAANTTVCAQLGSSTGKLVLLDTTLSSDVLNSSSGRVEGWVAPFPVQAALASTDHTRSRVCVGKVKCSLTPPRIKTIETLAKEWADSITEKPQPRLTVVSDDVSAAYAETASRLEGRVAMWIHNSCACGLTIGQDNTDQQQPLEAGVKLAYRWHWPSAPERIRFAAIGSSLYWSQSVPFVAGSYCVRLAEAPDAEHEADRFLHVRVVQRGARREMHVEGRLVLANLCRYNLLYKVKERCPKKNWRTLITCDLKQESFGQSVVCGANCDMVLKIKFAKEESGWSGDIPLKECPKENVPWLVKVPQEGEVPYTCVWCRVTRGRTDGRVLAAVWPLYTLRSHLALEAEVLITTETSLTTPTEEAPDKQQRTLQSVAGMGAATHLNAPGTTAHRHLLSFRYKTMECSITREAVPLHYGTTDSSVFEKRPPTNTIEEVVKEIETWLERTSTDATFGWPYSIVRKHISGPTTWRSAKLQPRADVTIRYSPVRAGGGCSLEIQLCPVVLLCNAVPFPLTLRAHDAAPLCKLESHAAIAASSIVVQKPFFISVESGRETFVSGPLQVCSSEPGRYGTLPTGHMALLRPAHFAIHCGNKVSLLTMHYEIQHEINILGVTPTYVLINKLKTNLTVSAVASSIDSQNLSQKSMRFKVIAPTPEGSVKGTPLTRFWVQGRWHGTDPAELRHFLCLGSVSDGDPTNYVPVRLGAAPYRRAVALRDDNNLSIPLVVTQHWQDGHWLVVVARDVCPQLLVHNSTNMALCIAQPSDSTESEATQTTAVADCEGTSWVCLVEAGSSVHYSPPSHAAAPPPAPLAPHPPPFVTLALVDKDDYLETQWSPRVALVGGEQLVQLAGGATLKARVQPHPHTTLLELLPVHETDISASDIRRRLLSITDSKLPQPESGIYQLNNVTECTSCGSEPSLVYATPLTDKPTKTFVVLAGEREIDHSTPYLNATEPEWTDSKLSWSGSERLRCLVEGIVVEVSANKPLLALHADRLAGKLRADSRGFETTVAVADIQIDNMQYSSGQYDFAVVASTRSAPPEPERWPPLWNMFAEQDTFATKCNDARLMVCTRHESWTVFKQQFCELTELEVSLGPLALYVEDAYLTALAELVRLAAPPSPADEASLALAEARILQQPLRLSLLHIHPLDLTLTLHTAVRMYIALDQSPLRLSEFKLHDIMTSPQQITHALTVHYLSAAILGAGWMVGGLELLGAPGAIAARVGGAKGGMKGVASATAAALVRSMSAWAGSLARNLDLLAGDEEHSRRAAAARRRPPQSFVAGLVTGITNFAVNILGAVGGLAHHPLVGPAVGEAGHGVGLRRGLLGALTKPLSATADLLAYAGTGLLIQTGWDSAPQPRQATDFEETRRRGWWQDCVRWAFRLYELNPIAGFEVLLDDQPTNLLITHRFLVVADPETEVIKEMIDFRYCSLGPFHGSVLEIQVTPKKTQKPETVHFDDENEFQVNSAAMARVARYTGAEGSAPRREGRALAVLPPPTRAHALYAFLVAAIYHNSQETHFSSLL